MFNFPFIVIYAFVIVRANLNISNYFCVLKLIKQILNIQIRSFSLPETLNQ